MKLHARLRAFWTRERIDALGTLVWYGAIAHLFAFVVLGLASWHGHWRRGFTGFGVIIGSVVMPLTCGAAGCSGFRNA